MIRIVIVRVHNLGQFEIGDLDVATERASSQQNVVKIQGIFKKFCFQEGLVFMIRL